MDRKFETDFAKFSMSKFSVLGLVTIFGINYHTQ